MYDTELYLVVWLQFRSSKERGVPLPLPLFLGSLWLGVVVPVKVSSIVQLEQFSHLLMILILINSNIMPWENYLYYILDNYFYKY